MPLFPSNRFLQVVGTLPKQFRFQSRHQWTLSIIPVKRIGFGPCNKPLALPINPRHHHKSEYLATAPPTVI